jgi:hypothetical protein
MLTYFILFSDVSLILFFIRSQIFVVILCHGWLFCIDKRFCVITLDLLT